MTADNHHQPCRDTGPFHFHASGNDLQLKAYVLEDATPSAAQIAAALGFRPNQQVSVLHWFGTNLEDLSPNETVDISDGKARFIVAESDGAWRLTIDGQRLDWLARHITVSTLRQLVNIPSDFSIYLEHEDEPDELLAEDYNLDLEAPGVERLASRRASWKLNVQGEILTLYSSTIIVREALAKAGFNPDQGWHIFLKVEGQPKEPVALDTIIDLSRPGIEKLRLTPKDVVNGEGLSTLARAFPVLDVDETFLTARHPGWEAISEGGRHWIVLPQYELPPGYSCGLVQLALEIPPTYPATQIDMFYLFPGVTLSTGAQIPATEAAVAIRGHNFQRWSRHRTAAGQWRSGEDNVKTHLALVDSALQKEVQL
jgi:hypothetical protein